MRRCKVVNVFGQPSSNMLYWSYNKRRQRLTITFRSGGIYRYENVPLELVQEARTAESVGKWFATNIRRQADRYPYTRLA